MGPDVLSVLRQLGAEGQVHQVVVCPVGFVSDHLEILFDLDVEAEGVAAEVGVGFARTASLNDDPAFVGLLADLVLEAGRTLGSPADRELTG
jgi:ferrochelatase